MRHCRFKIEGERAVYHCMTKVVGGDFLLGPREKEVLRKQMWKVARFCGLEVLTYCLMSNHFHVLVRTPDEGDIEDLSDADLLSRARCIYSPDKVEAFQEMLNSEDEIVRRNCRVSLRRRMGDVSQFMKELKQRFSIWYNRSREKRRTGTLWAERFKSVLVQDDPFALMTVAAYIDLNPVRAGIVDDPAEYRFCGYGEAMGGAKWARSALISMIGHGRESWSTVIRRYRVIVFGKGSTLKLRSSEGAAADARKKGRAVEPGKARRIMSEGGKVELSEALRCRVRYFSDGAVLGSKEFVQRYFEDHRAEFGVKRRDGPRPLKGSNWEGLSCIRDLRSEVFG